VADANRPVPWNKGRKVRPVSEKARADFLAGLADGQTVGRAAQRAGRDPRRFYELRNGDESFSVEWAEALEQGTQLIEDELRQRAVEGWSEALEEYRDGQLVRVTKTRRYSPALLIFLLKSRRPDVYRDSAVVRVTGHDGGPVQVEGYSPPTLADVLRLASELGIVEGDAVVEGGAVEESPLELERPE
jgi:hypothetical protein